MKNFGFVTMIIFLLFIIFFNDFVDGARRKLSSNEDEGHPIVSGEDMENSCPACHEMKLNNHGQFKCVAISNCCAGRSSSHLNCIVDPCFYYKKACPRANLCISQNCGSTGCKALYYDSKLNLVNPADCHRYVFQRSSSSAKIALNPRNSNSRRNNNQNIFENYNEKPPKIDIPSRLLQTSPNQFKHRGGENIKSFKFSKNQNQIWPSFFEFKGYEKPGACPTHQKYLIQVCTQECSKDDQCQGRKKCCWNGCTHRCVNPMQKADANFLNYPISGHWRRL